MNLVFIVNPVAGGGKAPEIAEEAREILSGAGHKIEIISSPDNAKITPPASTRYDRLLIFGGDGTLHRILNYWGIPDKPVALISAGSGNDFSRITTGTRSWKEQVKLAVEGEVKQIDLGLCNGIYFATGVGIGFDGKVAQMLNRNSKAKGFTAYMMAVIYQIFLYREKWVKITTTDLSMETMSFMLTIGNTSDFGGGFKVTPQALPNDGVLEVCLIKKVNLFQRLLHLDAVTKGKHMHLPFVEPFSGKKFRIEAKQELPCHMDGECYSWNKFNVEVLPNALEIIL